MKKFLFLLVTSIALVTVTYASFPIVDNNITINEPCDNIILKNGEEISAKIIEITPDLIKYKKCNNLDGPLISIYKDEVLMLRYKDGTKDLFNTSSDNQNNLTEERAGEFSSIMSLLVAVVGFFIALALPLGILAIILGVVGISHKENNLKAIAILGMLLGLINIILILSVL